MDVATIEGEIRTLMQCLGPGAVVKLDEQERRLMLDRLDELLERHEQLLRGTPAERPMGRQARSTLGRG